VFSSNLPLVEALERGAEVGARSGLRARHVIGGEPKQQWGPVANEKRPVLRTPAPIRNRIGRGRVHPLAQKNDGAGRRARDALAAVDGARRPRPPGQSRPCTGPAMQDEDGFACPITMTFAVVPALRAPAELARRVGALVTATNIRTRA